MFNREVGRNKDTGAREESHKPAARKLAARRLRRALLLLLPVVVLIAALDVRLRTVTYRVETDKVSAPIRIALLTDLHGCPYGVAMRTLLEAVGRSRPDAVLFGGDIFDDRLADGNTDIVLAALSARHPCYFTTGNHEYWRGDAADIKQHVRGYGITVLEGNRATLSIGGQQVVVAGVDDPDAFVDAAYRREPPAGDGFSGQLQQAGTGIDARIFTILLTHRPERIRSYMAYPFDLILAGHAHGGQWRVPGLVNGLLAPDQGWFPPYAGGLYDFGKTAFIVSRGLARESTRIPRLFNRPELVVVDIVPAGD